MKNLTRITLLLRKLRKLREQVESWIYCRRSKLARKSPASNLNNGAPVGLTPSLEQQNNQTKWVVDTMAGVTSAIAKASERVLCWSHSALESREFCNFRSPVVFDWSSAGGSCRLRLPMIDVSLYTASYWHRCRTTRAEWKGRMRTGERRWRSSFEEVTNARTNAFAISYWKETLVFASLRTFRIAHSKCFPRRWDEITHKLFPLNLCFHDVFTTRWCNYVATTLRMPRARKIEMHLCLIDVFLRRSLKTG